MKAPIAQSGAFQANDARYRTAQSALSSALVFKLIFLVTWIAAGVGYR